MRNEELQKKLQEELSQLYPYGPNQDLIWQQAGGDPAKITLTGETGNALWGRALQTLTMGGGGRSITLASLVSEALKAHPKNDNLLSLSKAIEESKKVPPQPPEEPLRKGISILGILTILFLFGGVAVFVHWLFTHPFPTPTSTEVPRGKQQNITRYATMYAGGEFEGPSISITQLGRQGGLTQMADMDNLASSCQVLKGYKLIVFKDPNYGGSSFEFSKKRVPGREGFQLAGDFMSFKKWPNEEDENLRWMDVVSSAYVEADSAGNAPPTP